MGQPALLVDNFFNTRMYPGHVLSAAEASTDAPLVGVGRRSSYDAYNSVTTNLDAWLKARCGVPRMADMIVVERDHNQGGKTVKVQCCDDDFVSTPQDAFNSITPSSPGTSSLDDALGVRNWEGAWLKRFSARAAQDWRYFVGAMGAGLVMTVPGLWIGLSWRPGFIDRPFGPGIRTLIIQEVQSDQGWIGRGKGVPRRQGILHFSFPSIYDGELALWHLEQYTAPHRMWVVPDDERAEDAFLATVPAEAVGESINTSKFYPQLDLPYLEADPDA